MNGFIDKKPQLLAIAIGIIATLIVLSDTLEDTLIEGTPSIGTPLAQIAGIFFAVTQNITATVTAWGYLGIFLLMLLESSSVPLPSEVILPFSGYLVSQGRLMFWLIVLVSTLAGVAGSLIDYCIGMKGMIWLTHHRSLRFLLSKKSLDAAERWFIRYGAFAVFINRLMPGFRTMISFPAGALKMPLLKFTACTAAGCLVWDALLIYLGLYASVNWRQVTINSRYIIIGVLISIVVAFIILLLKRTEDQD